MQSTNTISSSNVFMIDKFIQLYGYIKFKTSQFSRYAIAQMLDCLDQKYLCDDFTCVDWRLRCDGISQCPDRSDEASCAGQFLPKFLAIF